MDLAQIGKMIGLGVGVFTLLALVGGGIYQFEDRYAKCAEVKDATEEIQIKTAGAMQKQQEYMDSRFAESRIQWLDWRVRELTAWEMLYRQHLIDFPRDTRIRLELDKVVKEKDFYIQELFRLRGW